MEKFLKHSVDSNEETRWMRDCLCSTHIHTQKRDTLKIPTFFPVYRDRTIQWHGMKMVKTTLDKNIQLLKVHCLFLAFSMRY